MAAPLSYSKWDHIDDDSDASDGDAPEADREAIRRPQKEQPSSSSSALPPSLPPGDAREDREVEKLLGVNPGTNPTLCRALLRQCGGRGDEAAGLLLACSESPEMIDDYFPGLIELIGQWEAPLAEKLRRQQRQRQQPQQKHQRRSRQQQRRERVIAAASERLAQLTDSGARANAEAISRALELAMDEEECIEMEDYVQLERLWNEARPQSTPAHTARQRAAWHRAAVDSTASASCDCARRRST